MKHDWTKKEINFHNGLKEYLKKINREINHYKVATEPDARAIYRLLGKAGSLAPSWPSRYGGKELPYRANAFVAEQMVLHNISETLYVLSVLFVGGIILMEGTPEQKIKYLPRLASGDIFFSILYSEEGAGSDLANLKTVATKINDEHFSINGSKLYSLKSLQADYALCLARTSSHESKYKGLTIFIVPLADSKVTIKSIAGLADESFCRVDFNGLIVKRDNILGEMGQGWSVVNKAISLERTGLDFLIKAIKWYSLINQVLKLQTNDKIKHAKLRLFYEKIVNAKLYVYKLLDHFERHQAIDEGQASIAKLVCSELAVSVVNYAFHEINLSTLISKNDDSLLYSQLDSAFRESPGLTLSAGTSQMMLETIARYNLN